MHRKGSTWTDWLKRLFTLFLNPLFMTLRFLFGYRAGRMVKRALPPRAHRCAAA
jgi:hypothetical protein